MLYIQQLTSYQLIGCSPETFLIAARLGCFRQVFLATFPIPTVVADSGQAEGFAASKGEKVGKQSRICSYISATAEKYGSFQSLIVYNSPLFY